MVDGQAHKAFNQIADKWRLLAEKRRDYFLELHRTGRWKLYYSEPEFVLRMREVNAVVDTWAGVIDPAVVDIPKDETAPVISPQQNAA
jgi:uncharacterized repeat protein (TIGR03809 family)